MSAVNPHRFLSSRPYRFITMENFKQFLALCFFKHKEPEIASNVSLPSAILFYSLIALSIQGYVGGIGEAILVTFLEVILTLAFTGAVVVRNKVLEDFTPLCCAIFICTGFMGSLGIPFTLMLHMVKGKLAMFFIYSLVALMLWNIVVTKSLFQKTMMLSSFQSSFLAFLYFVIAYAVPFVGIVIF
jgi:hypothetical protein